MTHQMSPAGPQLLMLLAVAVSALLLAWIVSRALRRRPLRAHTTIFCALFVAYSAGLLGVSALSPALDLRPGDLKCFDEWCAGAVSVPPPGTQPTLTVHVRLQDRGRGAQRSNLARAFIQDGDRRLGPRNPDALLVTVPGGQEVSVDIRFDGPLSLETGRFVITEGGDGSPTPGMIVIGDEASPFHALAGWRLGDLVRGG